MTSNSYKGKRVGQSGQCPAKSFSISTRTVHSGNHSNHWTYSPLVTPLYMSSTFETLDLNLVRYEYSRCNNPTRTELEKFLSNAEFAKFSLAFSSGLGTILTLTYLLESGNNILCSDDVYGGTNKFFAECSTRMGITTTFVDGTLLENWIDNFKIGQTKMIWIESPTNPTMKVMDIENIASVVRRLDPNCLIVVDNTFMTPVFQSPLKLGADIVMHSCTKYINGHSDVIMGAMMTNEETIFERLKFFQTALGVVPSAFDCWLVIRSIKTLHVRVKHQAESALEIAKFLEGHKFVTKVLYPGLESHPQHELMKRQCSGFGGMISIYVKEQVGGEATKIAQACHIFHMAVSLGCVCSLVEIPTYMTHSNVPEDERAKLAITPNLLRLSIGLEDVNDLKRDLDQAINSAYKP